MREEWAVWQIHGPRGLALTKAQVALLLGVSEKTIDRMVAERRFPAGIHPSPKAAPLWSGLDLAAYLHLQGRLLPERHEPEKTDDE